MTVPSTARRSTPAIVTNIVGRTYKAEIIKNGKVETIQNNNEGTLQTQITTHKATGGTVHRDIYGSIGTPEDAAQRRLSGDKVAELTVNGLKRRYEAGGLSEKDQELANNLLHAKDRNLFQRLTGATPQAEVDPKAFRELSSNYTQKQELLKKRNERDKTIKNEEQYSSDLRKTVVDQIANLPNDKNDSFSNAFYKNRGERHEGKDLTVNLPADTKRRQAVLDYAKQAKGLQSELETARKELERMDVNATTTEAKVLRGRKERQVADLQTNIKIAENNAMNLLKTETSNKQLKEYLETSKAITKSVKEQEIAAKKEIEALIGEAQRQPVPPATPTTPTTPTTPPVVTEEVAQSKVQKLLDGIKEKHGLNDISGDSEITLTYPDGRTLTKKVKDLEDRDLDTSTKATEAKKTKENEKEAPKLTAGGWFRGFDADGNPLKEGFTWGGGLRSLGTAVVGVSVLRKIWSWLFPEDQITRAQLDALKARGGAV